MGVAHETAPAPVPIPPESRPANGNALADRWRTLSRFATFVAVLAAPAILLWCEWTLGLNIWWSLVMTVFCMAAIRGLIDVLLRKAIPWPNLFGADRKLLEEDVVNRRRAWSWRWVYKTIFTIAVIFAVVNSIVYLLMAVFGQETDWLHAIPNAFAALIPAQARPSAITQFVMIGLQLPIFFLINILVLFGPLLFFSLMQIKGYEPGDADWGVRFDDVRGQKTSKEEVRRIVALWQSGEEFERAGGKRERGILFNGPPGTGKTMLAKALATSFNSPIVTIPGSGFAQTFIGMDAMIVRYMAWKAKRLARKWGGQCIVFIDEIDAVGMRRSSLGTAASPLTDGFHGPMGTWAPGADEIIESAAWRDYIFTVRYQAERSGSSAFLARVGAALNAIVPGMFGGGGGQQGLQQLLVVMDGIGEPRSMKKFRVNKVNAFLDAMYVIPRHAGGVRLRLRPARPTTEQIYFIGACNVPIEALDPALTRPGRMGRHVFFRTPTKRDRLDIFDLYLAKVAHEPDLDTDARRDELARITSGYSPAMIDQLCSLALTYAHHDGRDLAGWGDMVEAMQNVEAGTATSIEFVDAEARAVAVHEAGHAIASALYEPNLETTRLTIRPRGGYLGLHVASQVEERFTAWRHELMGRLIAGLGAMAAEQVVYGDTSSGVSGDLWGVTSLSGRMVGAIGMGPERVDLHGRFPIKREEDEARERMEKRFEHIGRQLMAASVTADGQAPDREKSATAAKILGHAYVIAYNTMRINHAAIDRIADVLVEKRELHGNEIADLLHECELVAPDIDYLEERSWPKV
jgi:ATP-dependent Zn protease